jgi:prevent-host-death family protein
MDMTRLVNVAELKNSLSEVLEAAMAGEEITICRRNVPVARLSAVATPRNRTRLGFAPGVVADDVDGPAIPEDDWDMLKPGGPT